VYYDVESRSRGMRSKSCGNSHARYRARGVYIFSYQQVFQTLFTKMLGYLQKSVKEFRKLQNQVMLRLSSSFSVKSERKNTSLTQNTTGKDVCSDQGAQSVISVFVNTDEELQPQWRSLESRVLKHKSRKIGDGLSGRSPRRSSAWDHETV
jgi:hypothetical protein